MAAELRAAEDIYDPARDLAAVLHGARQQGCWGPAVRGALARLEAGLHLTETKVPSDVEAAVRARLDQVAKWRHSLELPELRWAPYQEFGIPDPAAEAQEAPAGPVTVGAVGRRGNDIIIYWLPASG